MHPYLGISKPNTSDTLEYQENIGFIDTPVHLTFIYGARCSFFLYINQLFSLFLYIKLVGIFQILNMENVEKGRNNLAGYLLGGRGKLETLHKLGWGIQGGGFSSVLGKDFHVYQN